MVMNHASRRDPRGLISGFSSPRSGEVSNFDNIRRLDPMFHGSEAFSSALQKHLTAAMRPAAQIPVVQDHTIRDRMDVLDCSKSRSRKTEAFKACLEADLLDGGNSG